MLRLHLAAENMLDALFEKRLKANDLLPLGEDGKLLLVETSIFSAPMNFMPSWSASRTRATRPCLPILSATSIWRSATTRNSS